jgi:hypothetical protein
MLGGLSAGRLRTDLRCRPRRCFSRAFALGHANSSHSCRRNSAPAGRRNRAPPTTQTPRRPVGAGGGRGASRSGSLAVLTTHALFARKVQRKLSNGVAGFAPGGSSLDRQTSSPIRASARGRPRDVGTGPELRTPGAAAQPRMVSVVRIRLDSHKSMRPFKGIICDDISEFESYHLSHAVGSLEPRTVSVGHSRAQRKPRVSGA